MVVASQGEHLVRHVKPVRLPARGNALCREEHVDSAAAAKVQHHLARLQLRERGRIPAAERREDRRLREFVLLELIV